MVTADEFILQHFGVKGMKWGHRKGSTATSKAGKKVAKADKKFESVNARYSKTFEIADAARTSFKSSGDLKKISDKYSSQLTSSFSANRQVKKAYDAEVQQSFMKHLKAAADKQSPNASGTRKYTITVPPKRPDRWIVTTTEIKHASESVEFEIVRDKNGLIIDIKPVTDLQQSALAAEEFLEHYGVKGMKWGKRKNPASADAAAKATTKTAVKSKGLHTVSNADLQTAIRRMQLEQDFKRLSTNERSVVARWISSTIQDIGRQQVNAQVKKKFGPKEAAKTVAKTAAVKAATGGLG